MVKASGKSKSVEPSANGMKGVVKSYHGQKGFGFINSDGVGEDIYFMRKDMPQDMRDVQGKFLEGRAVTFTLGLGADGRHKATEVKLDESENAVEDIALPGVIKSFSHKNGYGFISSSSLEGDVRFELSAMHGVLPGVDLKGALVSFKVQALADGKFRAAKVDFQSGKKAKAYKQDAAMGMIMPAFGFGMQQTMNMSSFGNQGGGKKQSGTVKSFNDAKGFGFISMPGYPEDIKFGNSDLIGGVPSAGTTVQFTMAINGDGRASAKQVRVGGGGMKRSAAAAPTSAPFAKQMKGSGKGKAGKGLW